MNYNEVIKQLKKTGSQKNIDGMSRFGIKTKNNLGNSVTDLRNYAKKIGKDHNLAIKLWESGIRDARIIAVCIEDPKTVSEEQIEKWVKDFDSWDICDHCCGHLIDKTPFAYKKAKEWTKRKEEFQKRAGFALIAWLAVHDKKADNSKLEDFFELMKKESTDDRNYVRKAISWALRNIGKRNLFLNRQAIKVANDIKKIDSKSAKWIASDTIRELNSEKIQKRIKK